MKKSLRPVVVDGNVIEDYAIDKDGNIWSSRTGTQWKKLRPAGANGPSNYPRVSLRISTEKSKTFFVHRLVCEAFHKFPHPDGVSKSEWNKTPASVKKLLNGTYQVNHIDHDHFNFHPSNLEWVTVKANAKKYQQHRTS